MSKGNESKAVARPFLPLVAIAVLVGLALNILGALDAGLVVGILSQTGW